MINKVYDPESVNNILGTLIEAQRRNAVNINEISNRLSNISVNDIIDYVPHVGGTGVSISTSNEISIGQEVNTDSSVEFNTASAGQIIASKKIVIDYAPGQFDIQTGDLALSATPEISGNIGNTNTPKMTDHFINIYSASGDVFKDASNNIIKTNFGQIRVFSLQTMNISAETVYTYEHVYGTSNASSDARIKSNEVPLENATTTLLKLNPLKYDLHPSLVTDEISPDLTNVKIIKKAGFIAQEIQNDCPELSYLVKDTAIKSVDYISLIPYIIKCLQEIDSRLATLEP
tara:strand:+ start:939 stop:1805 length:867 start_codon:yes stop_codon:yes gene_type:complete